MLAVAVPTPADLRQAGEASTSGSGGGAEASLQLYGAAGAGGRLRKCVSTPSLTALGAPAGSGLEVYVVMRSFTEFGGGLFRKLPAPVRRGVRDAGLCHYMTVFKAPDGSLVQFDFGPKGGDIHVARGPFARLLSKQPVPGRAKVAPGEVRWAACACGGAGGGACISVLHPCPVCVERSGPIYAGELPACSCGGGPARSWERMP